MKDKKENFHISLKAKKATIHFLEKKRISLGLKKQDFYGALLAVSKELFKSNVIGFEDKLKEQA